MTSTLVLTPPLRIMMYTKWKQLEMLTWWWVDGLTSILSFISACFTQSYANSCTCLLHLTANLQQVTNEVERLVHKRLNVFEVVSAVSEVMLLNFLTAWTVEVVWHWLKTRNEEITWKGLLCININMNHCVAADCKVIDLWWIWNLNKKEWPWLTKYIILTFAFCIQLTDGYVVSLTHFPLLHRGRFLVLFSVRGWVHSRAIERLEGLGKLEKLS
jgi:hypothetical protein